MHKFSGPQQWIDFAPFEIDANILAFYRPRIRRAVYRPLVSCILFYYGIIFILFWHLNDNVKSNLMQAIYILHKKSKFL